MKPLKVAAVVAGSMMALGAAAPAFAAETPAPAGPSLSLNGGVDELLSHGLEDPQVLHTNMLDTEREGSVLNAANDVTNALNKKSGAKPRQTQARQSNSGGLLGGLPLLGPVN
ncbi:MULTISPECIES: hypothetical protein [unclassified Streptomyces]|uniref:hypothetical protein n=1 Tax=unclassified Streptomyces TaxID=2593676 RepID=UPI003810E031